MLAGLASCEEEAIRSYDAPKDPPSRMPRAEVPPAGPMTAPSQAGAARATWVKPESWRVDPQGASFAMASFLAGPEDAATPTKITLTQLAGEGGGLMANVNRWRGQLGLDAVATIDEQTHAPVVLGDIGGIVVDMTASAGAYGDDPLRTVGVIAFHAGEAWFVKMTGPASVVESARPAFDAFVASVRIPHNHEH